MRRFLYYAGMSGDRKTEQIGLAVSENHRPFERVGVNGLIIPTVPQLEWKNLRTCNPSVVQAADSSFVMIYQGIASQAPLNVSLGWAYSKEGEEWIADDTPTLSPVDFETIDPTFDSDHRVGPIEPSLLVEDGKMKIWFIYLSHNFKGNALFYAEKEGDNPWKIGKAPLLMGDQFSDLSGALAHGSFTRLHYPQILKTEAGYDLYFALINVSNRAHGIFKMTSTDGLKFDNIRQVLPYLHSGIHLQPGQPPKLSVVSSDPMALVVKIASALRHKTRALLSPGLLHYGYSHPHILPREKGSSELVYHGYHSSKKGTYTDIRSCQLNRDGPHAHRCLLTPGHPSEWDSFFVADPYLLEVQGTEQAL